jgi:asparagine synthase (glutamine-hydrolysing)
MKVRDGRGKWLMRETLYKHVPKTLIDRPKRGFGIPLDVWLRGPLREWAEDLLSESRLKREGFFHAAPIRQKWAEHLSGTRNWHFYLWDVLMFQAWHSEQTQSVSETPLISHTMRGSAPSRLSTKQEELLQAARLIAKHA